MFSGQRGRHIGAQDRRRARGSEGLLGAQLPARSSDPRLSGQNTPGVSVSGSWLGLVVGRGCGAQFDLRTRCPWIETKLACAEIREPGLPGLALTGAAMGSQTTTRGKFERRLRVLNITASLWTFCTACSHSRLSAVESFGSCGNLVSRARCRNIFCCGKPCADRCALEG